MPTRREFCQTAATLAAGAILPLKLEAATAESAAAKAPYHSDKPLHQLQQEFLDLRMGMFIHFNMATFQDREWGDPTGPVSAFNPTHLDTDQWAEAAKSAGMGYACLTTKHHDGFPLWPTKTVSDHAGIDVVRAYVASFRKAGIKVGLYFSILDLRHDVRHFNVTPEKVSMIKTQLTELLANYGDIDILIFDGWDAGWSRITYEEVSFHEIYGLVKKLQPNCLISELNAGSYPSSALYYSDIKAFEQNAGQHIPGESSIPAQSCVTLTDGWFWKTGDEDRPLKTVQQVVHEWLVPQNAIHCNLIVNAPPNREGRLAPNLVARLAEIGAEWKNPGPADKVDPAVIITTSNLASKRPCHANINPDGVGADQAFDGSFGSTWNLVDGLKEGWLEVELPKGTSFNTLALVEPVGRWDDYKESRIASYKFQKFDKGGWVDLASGTNPTPVRLHSISTTKAERVRVSIVAKVDSPHISEVGIYLEPGF